MLKDYWIVRIFGIVSEFQYIHLGSQLHYKKYNQKLHQVEYYDGK